MTRRFVQCSWCAAALYAAAGCSSGSPYAGAPPAAAGPKAYVGLFGDDAVAVIDTAANQVVKTIPVPAGPHGLVITPDGAKVYVSSDGATQVSVIATATDSVVASIEVGASPQGLAISRDGARVLLSAFGSDQARVIDTATDRVVASVAVPRPHNSAIDPSGTLAYVGSQKTDAPSITVVDMNAGTVATSVALDHAPRALDAPTAGTVYFTVSGADALETLDTATGTIGAPIPTGGSPHHMLGTPDGAIELVVSQTAGDLEYVDTATRTVVARVPTGTMPHWIALDAHGKLAYVTDETSNDVAVIDLAARRVVTTIPVGNAPRKIAVQR